MEVGSLGEVDSLGEEELVEEVSEEVGSKLEDSSLEEGRVRVQEKSKNADKGKRMDANLFMRILLLSLPRAASRHRGSDKPSSRFPRWA